MDDLISRRDVIELLATMQGQCANKSALIQNSKIWQQIKDLPSAQPEIIYCKDCVHHIDGFFCRQANHHTSDKDHCASVFGAERREE